MRSGSPFAASLAVLSVLVSTPALAQETGPNYAGYAGVFLQVAIFAIFYFIPSIVGFWRRHPNRWAIFVINTVFGGTGLGWLGSLVWAMHAVHVSDTGSDGGESGLNLFANDPVKVRVEPSADATLAKATGAAPTPPRTEQEAVAQLRRLKGLRDDGVLTPEEYERLRAPIIAGILA